jgi:hypothetical protein
MADVWTALSKDRILSIRISSTSMPPNGDLMSQINSDPDEIDASLRVEADQMLDSGLRDILAGYGDVRVVGSYRLRLMAWRDLDVELVREKQDRQAFFELGYNIAACLSPLRMQYRDETLGRTPGLPQGLYWGVYLGDERQGAWKIDVWSVDRRHADATQASASGLLGRLSHASRQAIIDIKSQVWTDPRYRRAFSSVDIYEAVLDHGVCDVEAFLKYLQLKQAVDR